jgi:hypothetical protein
VQLQKDLIVYITPKKINRLKRWSISSVVMYTITCFCSSTLILFSAKSTIFIHKLVSLRSQIVPNCRSRKVEKPESLACLTSSSRSSAAVITSRGLKPKSRFKMWLLIYLCAQLQTGILTLHLGRTVKCKIMSHEKNFSLYKCKY